jgi:hypothetical protein
MEFYDYPTNKPDKRGIYIALDSNGEYKPVYWSENKRRFSSWNMQAGKFLNFCHPSPAIKCFGSY